MNTDQLVTTARVRFEHEAARQLQKEKYQAKMLFAYAGGMWRAGPELLTVLQACPVDDEIVLLDLYDTPCRVKPVELQHLAFDRWQEQMNAWLIEYEESRKQR